jgi:small GTP-binding protein
MKTAELQQELRQVHQQQGKIELTITELTQQFEATGDQQTSYKVKELLKKWQENTLNVGFCGHFSSGKSTMINQLLEKSLLPASPIPTSANLVILRQGKPRAEIYFTDGTHKKIDVSQLEQWKAYCKDGQEVEKVEIYDDHPILQGDMQLLDTPGIDSTDEAHQGATEAALHLADVIFFVTDYNHVQSEVNFSFIKSLKEKGKTLFLIINQVDKHREKELSLKSFRERVKEGLKEWGITLDGLLFTSLKEPQHPYNQFKQIGQLLEQAKEEKTRIIQDHFFDAHEVLLQEHGQFLQQQQAGSREKLNDKIEDIKEKVDWQDNPTFLKEYHQSQQAPSVWQKEIEAETGKILENAIITPYVTTQLAQELIESYQKDFKVGVLFTGKKTELERKRRLDVFYEDISERVISQIEWHLKELLRKNMEEFHIEDRSFHSEIMDWKLTLPKEWLTDLIQRGTVSSEYVYIYTKELTQKIHRLYRTQMNALTTTGKEKLDQHHEEKYQPLQATIEQHHQIEELEGRLQQLDQDVLKQLSVYRQTLKEYQGSALGDFKWQVVEQIEEQVEEQLDHVESAATGKLQVGNTNKGKKAVNTVNHQDQFQQQHEQLELDTRALQQTAEQLEKAGQLLQQIPTLGSLVKEFGEKANRLKNNRFTICLFGAFSAGKSSFANALLGSGVLPVSPNPTTAAINQVLPSSKENPAGSATIKMKSRTQVEEEIHLSLQRLQLSTKGSMGEQLKQIEAIQPHQLRTSLKPYYSFLQACHKGWEEATTILDTHFKVEENEFTQYVAVEKKACFVESIQLYHDSYLTQNGLEIIDTPGADSIYSRHTNVTFNYIKNADVILYVTYYNHAFSRADRQFLDQLGRVKDQFALDKMFFMVNAADLAQSEEELAGVVEHVEQNLLQSGIQFPRIFPISSLEALEGVANSGMEEFEKAFFSFIQEDLTQLLVGSARKDLERGYAFLSEINQELRSSAEVKQAKIEQLQAQERTWVASIEQEEYPAYLKEMEKEIKELLYYVKQRLFFGFQQHVNDAFHPSVLSGERGGKKQLSLCLEEVLFSSLFQLKEELKATSLRLEKFTYRLLDRALIEWQERTESEGIILTGGSIQRDGFDIPHFPEHYQIQDRKGLEDVLGYFKNAKNFFEQGGKEKLREGLEQNLEPLVSDYMVRAEANLLEFYQQAWLKVEQEMKKGLAEELSWAVSSRLSALRGDITANDVEKIMDNYKKQVLARV